MAIQKSELEKIVGKKNVFDDDKTLGQYAQDQSFVPRRKPTLVAYAETVEQVQQVVQLANKTLTPVIPYSSGKNLHGATIPDQGGVILNLSKMNKIIEVDEENWFVIVEPGVTYQQLQDAMGKRGYYIMVPFGVPPDRSVLSSYLERDPVMAAPSFEYGNAIIMDTEIILPTGELFRTGNWATGGKAGGPNGPIRTLISRLWSAAQGTLGIMTKMALHINPIPKMRKIFFLPFDELSQVVEPLSRIQRREIGMECFLLNRFNLAALLNDGWQIPKDFPAAAAASEEFAQLRSELPAWTLVLSIQSSPRHPEEKIAYEEEALREICDGLNVKVLEGLPNIPGAENVIAAELLRPWKILKKFNYRGSVHDLTFKAPLNKVTAIEQAVKDLADKHNYPLADIGMYLLPLERGRGIHCEFDLHCSPADEREWNAVKELWLKSSTALMNGGAYFDRPYGAWADMVYGRAADYAIKLKQIKKEIDPNNIMNPGKLCFSC
jgi:FAD/FMN-containing dehydrogenase